MIHNNPDPTRAIWSSPVYFNGMEVNMFRADNERRLAEFGPLPKCRKCGEACRQPNCPGLIRVVCSKDADFAELENKYLGEVNDSKTIEAQAR